MASDLFAQEPDSSSQDLLAPEPKSEAPVSEPPTKMATTYLTDVGLSVDHPADMSHDLLNDSIQGSVYGRPRNIVLDPNAPDLGERATKALQGLFPSAALAEPELLPEAAKSGMRMVESIPKGISGLISMVGQNGMEWSEDQHVNLVHKVAEGMRDIGETSYQFYKARGEKGWEAPDPEVFRGAFMSNPSVTRLVSGVIQNVPIVAAVAAASVATGGAAPLALFGSMAAGESYEGAKETGSSTGKASAVGVVSGIGNTVLMSLPIGPALLKMGVPAEGARVVGFGALGALMTPFNNIMAKMGGDKTRQIADGMMESILTLALSGYILGGFEKGGAAKHDELVSEAAKAGVTPQDIDSARAALTEQIIDNSAAVNKALKEKMNTDFDFGANAEKKAAAATPETAPTEEAKATPEQDLRERDAQEAQKTLYKLEDRQDFLEQVGKMKRPEGDFLKEELHGLRRSFFTDKPGAEALDEVAQRMDMTSDELIQRLRDISKTTGAADKESMSEAKKTLERIEDEISEELRIQKEAGREYVKNEPFRFRLGKNDKKSAQLLVAEAAGLEKVQRVRGNQLGAEIEKLVPDPVQREGINLFRSVEGDREFLQEALTSDEMAPYKQQIEAALNMTPEMEKATQMLDRAYTEAGEVSKEIGTVKELHEAYQNAVYKPEKETDFIGSEAHRSGLPISSSHGKQKFYNNPFEAILAGKVPATLDASKLWKLYNEEMAKANTNRKLADIMAENSIAKWSRVDKVPDDWAQVGTTRKEVALKDKDGKAVIGEDGNQEYASHILVVPKGIAEGLRVITDPNWLNKIELARGLAKVQGVIKTADVAFSFFHDKNVMGQSLYNRGFQDLLHLGTLDRDMMDPEFKKREQFVAREMNVTTHMTNQNIDILQSLQEAVPELKADLEKIPGIGPALAGITELPGAKEVGSIANAVMEISDKHTQFLFDKALRYLKVQHGSALAADWVAKNPTATNEQVSDAHRQLGKFINATYGGLDWQTVGLSKTTVGILRLGLFAPDWTLGKLQVARMALGGEGAATQASRGSLLRTVLIGGLITQGLNHIFTGHFTDQNEKGHFMEIEIAPGVHISMLTSVAEDAINLTSRVMSQGPFKGGLGFAQGKVAPLVRLGAGLISGVKYSGSPIVDRKHLGHPWSISYDYLKYILTAAAPLPFSVSNLAEYLGSEVDKNAASGALVASGLARYSGQHKTKGESFA